jgi:hypothetical protein
MLSHLVGRKLYLSIGIFQNVSSTDLDFKLVGDITEKNVYKLLDLNLGWAGHCMYVFIRMTALTMADLYEAGWHISTSERLTLPKGGRGAKFGQNNQQAFTKKREYLECRAMGVYRDTSMLENMNLDSTYIDRYN